MIQPKFRYLPTFLIPPVAVGNTSIEEVVFFRNLFGLPAAPESCPLEDVVYVLNTGPDPGMSGNHFCTVAFMPSEKLIYILGRKYNQDHFNYDDKDWGTWDGIRIWSRVCTLFGWNEVGLGTMTLCSVDWVQNGYDCGPIACQIVWQLMTNGKEVITGDLDWNAPKLPCCHALRKKMAEVIHGMILDGIENFDNLGDLIKNEEGYQSWKEGRRDLRKALELDPASVLKDVVVDIDNAMMDCLRCQEMLQDVEGRGHPIPVKRRSLGEVNKGRLKNILKGAHDKAMLVNERINDDQEEFRVDDQGEFRVDEEEEDSEEDEEGGVERKVKAIAWKEARVGRFPRQNIAPKLPLQTSLRGLNLPFDPQFDDYYNGPTMDSLLEIPPEIMGYDASLVYLANQILTSPWSTFKDYGYRLLPSYAQNFDLGEPVMFKEHLCPVGLSNPPLSIEEYHSEGSGRDGAPVRSDDKIVMGAEQMMKTADDQDSDMILLTGKIQDGGFDQYIVVDLLKDRVDPDPDRINYSCDIDSLIWVTHDPRFIGAIGVYTAPMIRPKAPIWKNNHVRVETLFPQTEEDRANGPREEWWTKSWSLSNIPHLLFGSVYPAASTADILLFFPRMCHQDTHRHFWVNKIPSHVQNLLWDRVITPAFQSVQTPNELVYIPVDRQHLRLRDGLGKGTKRVPLIPLQGERMEDVKKEMSRLVSYNIFKFLGQTNMEQIKNGGDSLAQFGSFFFVVQVKGSKRLAHSHGDSLKESSKQALVNFQKTFTGLDWDYMSKRESGELICDVGITVQPTDHHTPDGLPFDDDIPQLVGLWRLDCLEASYGAGGYLSGNLHTLNTLSMFGGLQAESPVPRRRRAHISFRSSYNLAYEVIRQQDNSRNIFEEKEVYNRSPWYHDQMEKVLEIYTTKASSQSHGVRDEFRISGQGFNDLIECIDDSVCFLFQIYNK